MAIVRSMASWRFIECYGLASEFHADPMIHVDLRTVRFLEVARNAMVLGSSQDPSQIDAGVLNRFDAELVVRRSGGGAVYLSPSNQLWIDISIPKQDRLYCEDLRRSFLPIGSLVLEALSEISSLDFQMHSGPLVGGELGRAICFAGIGPGEITVEGAKVVGISQRRTQKGAVFQCTMYLRYPLTEMEEIMSGLVDSMPLPGYALGLVELETQFLELDNSTIIARVTEAFKSVLTKS